VPPGSSLTGGGDGASTAVVAFLTHCIVESYKTQIRQLARGYISDMYWILRQNVSMECP
jgi:hypothetical protein